MSSSDSWTEEASCRNATVSTSEPADVHSKFATTPNDTVAKRRSAKFADASQINRTALAIPACMANLSDNRLLHVITLVHSNVLSFMWVGVKYAHQTKKRYLLIKADRGVDLVYCQAYVKMIWSPARLLLCRSLQDALVMSCADPTQGYVLLAYRHTPLVHMPDTLPVLLKIRSVWGQAELL